MLGSVLIALATLWTAIACSFESNWPVGFFVATFSAAWFGLGRAVAAARQRRGPWAAAPPSRWAEAAVAGAVPGFARPRRSGTRVPGDRAAPAPRAPAVPTCARDVPQLSQACSSASASGRT